MVLSKRSNYIDLIQQRGALKSYFPDSEITRKSNSAFTWKGTVQPTPLSRKYTLKLKYKKRRPPKVFVIDPKPLPLAKGEKVLPHIYDHKKQWLCLHYPSANEWDPSMYLVKTIIPWAIEWLMHYEIWLGIGDWRGGGIEH